MQRDREVRVRLTELEYTAVKAAADAAWTTPPALARRALAEVAASTPALPDHTASLAKTPRGPLFTPESVSIANLADVAEVEAAMTSAMAAAADRAAVGATVVTVDVADPADPAFAAGITAGIAAAGFTMSTTPPPVADAPPATALPTTDTEETS